MEFTPEELRGWMDRQIEAYKILDERLILKEETDYEIEVSIKNLSAAARSGIHIDGTAVRYFSKVLGIEMSVRERSGDKKYPYEIYIMYRDTKFLGIETEEEYRKRGAIA